MKNCTSCQDKTMNSGSFLRTGNNWNNATIHRRSLRFGNKQKNLRHRYKLRELGLWYDYPNCCIESFVRYSPKNRTDLQRSVIDIQHKKKVFKYVPCNNCSKKYLKNLKTHQMTLRN